MHEPQLTEQEWEVARWWLRGLSTRHIDKALGLPEGESRRHQAAIIQKITGSYDEATHSMGATGPLHEVGIWILVHDPNPPDWYWTSAMRGLPGCYRLTREPTSSWWLNLTHFMIRSVVPVMILGVLVVIAALVGFFPVGADYVFGRTVGGHLLVILEGIVVAFVLIWLWTLMRDY